MKVARQLTVVKRSGLTVVTVPEYCIAVSVSTDTRVAVACAVLVTRASRVVVTIRVLRGKVPQRQDYTDTRTRACPGAHDVTGGGEEVTHFVETVAEVVPE